MSTADAVKVVASRRYGTLSPLRYPGGKAALAGFFADVFTHLGLQEVCYVEPYAGGAGAGIALLREGVIDHLVINDFDPAVYAFWQAVTSHNAEFIELIETTPLTIPQWRHQQAIYRAGDITRPVELGFAFFYLNRTNRSGILNAGVIGGLAQQGRYRIDARFNRTTLVERVKAIGDLAHRISVTDLDGRSVLTAHADDPRVFFYIDPPYVEAGSQLYLNAFDGRDHIALAKIITSIEAAHWLLTYDHDPLIEGLYRSCPQFLLELTYSARHPGRAQELLIASPQIAAAITDLHPHRQATA
ncbi:MAG: DNA adenine methylase [Propionibacteriaceae bacterium]|nr:DNA adenine methylase [Propionibacteriaceae bacterium]